ncbi:MAG: HEPN domain-containing protein [Candidatus Helarchaeota archaeon]
MKRSKDWLNQAKADLEAANNSLKAGDYAWTCFLAQQTAEKSFKALGEEFGLMMWGHDLVDLLKPLKKIISIPDSIEIHCKTLNLYYISTRYPDAFTSGYPAEKFSENQAKDAITIAKEVLKFATDKLNENRETIEESS